MNILITYIETGSPKFICGVKRVSSILGKEWMQHGFCVRFINHISNSDLRYSDILGIPQLVFPNSKSIDCLENFAYMHLELKATECFVLYYKEKNGDKKRETGKYSYNNKEKTVTMRLDNCSFFKREFPLQKGVLTISLPLGEQNLMLKFKQK